VGAGAGTGAGARVGTGVAGSSSWRRSIYVTRIRAL
jgi:hypothetical protein